MQLKIANRAEAMAARLQLANHLVNQLDLQWLQVQEAVRTRHWFFKPSSSYASRLPMKTEKKMMMQLQSRRSSEVIDVVTQHR